MTGAEPRVLTGRCYCEALVYEVADDFRYGNFCHCSKCRRKTGSAFTAFVGIAAERVRVTAGHDLLGVYGDSELDPDGWHFCKRCGTTIFATFDVGQGRMAHVQLGTLDTVPATLPGEHIFVGSKAVWDTIPDDGLPRYKGHVHEG